MLEGLLIIGGALFIGLVVFPATLIWDTVRRRKWERQQRHKELVAAARNQPPPAPDIRGRHTQG